MSRRNLLVLGLMLFTLTGCCATVSHNCGPGHQFGSKKPQNQRLCRKCHRKGCCQGAQSTPAPLFPGDMYGQPFPGYPNACMISDPCMMSQGTCEPGGAGYFGGCSGCGEPFGADMSPMGGCASCGGSSMPHSGAWHSADSGCGCGQMGHGSPAVQGFSPQNQLSPSPGSPSLKSGTPAPLPPAEVFEAPKSDGTLPPVPSDPPGTEGAPKAAPAVDPVSWTIPNHQQPNHPTFRR